MIDDIVKELRELGRDGLAVRLEQSAAAVEASHSAEVLELTSQLEAAEERVGELETANAELTSQLEARHPPEPTSAPDATAPSPASTPAAEAPAPAAGPEVTP